MSMSIFHDFLPMWAAGRAIQLGIDPYDPTVIASILYDTLQAEGQTLNAWPGGFMYPPWSLWIFFLFSLQATHQLRSLLARPIFCGAVMLSLSFLDRLAQIQIEHLAYFMNKSRVPEDQTRGPFGDD